MNTSMLKAPAATIAVAIAAISLSGTASADPRIFDLFLKNGMKQPVSIMLSNEGHNCYEGSVPIGSLIGPIAPGATSKIVLARVQGHGCDGEQGVFRIAPIMGANEPQDFNFDNAGHLALSNKTYSYTGTLSPKDMSTLSYTWTLSPGY